MLEPPTVAVPIELAELPRIRLPPVEKLEAPSTSSVAVAPALFPTSAWLATLTEELFTVNVCEERMSRPLSYPIRRFAVWRAALERETVALAPVRP